MTNVTLSNTNVFNNTLPANPVRRVSEPVAPSFTLREPSKVAKLTSALIRNTGIDGASALIKLVDDKNLVIDEAACISLDAASFAKEVLKAIQQGAMWQHLSYKVAASIGWGLKSALIKYTRGVEGKLALTMEMARINGDRDAACSLAHNIRRIADTIEATYDQFAAHADCIASLTQGYELHPFMVRLEADYTMDIESYDDNGDSDDELDEADLWLRDIEHAMRPSEGSTRPANDWKSASNNEPRSVWEAISKEEYVNTMLDRTQAEWSAAAKYVVWQAIGDIMERVNAEMTREHKRKGEVVTSPVAELFPNGLPTKKVPFITKLRSKLWDLKARASRINDRCEYIEREIDRVDGDKTQQSIAAVSNAKREDDLAELRVERTEIERNIEMLEEWVRPLNKLSKLIDTKTLGFELSQYSFFAGFNMVDYVATRLKERDTQLSVRHTDTHYRKNALKMLGTPDVTELNTVVQKPKADGSIEEVPSTLYVYSFTEDRNYTEIAKTLSNIRYQYTVADKSVHTVLTFLASQKDSAMKNKKVSFEAVGSLMDSLSSDLWDAMSK